MEFNATNDPLSRRLKNLRLLLHIVLLNSSISEEKLYEQQKQAVNSILIIVIRNKKKHIKENRGKHDYCSDGKMSKCS